MKNVSSSIKACASFLFKISNGVSLKPSNTTSTTLQSSFLLSRKISSFGRFLAPIELENECSVRNISTFGPLLMGRRACKIADRKEAQNDKKMKLYARMGKEVVSAVKKGGPNPGSNTALAALFEKAKELDVPRDMIERNIKRASEKGQEAYIEKFYELYGYGGVGIIAEVLTDKVNRAVGSIRSVVRDYGGKMADSGSIMFKFKRARVATIKVTDVDKDQLLSIALEAGADDVIDPSVDEDNIGENSSERVFKVVSSAENYPTILWKLREEGISFETDKGFELVPLTPVEVCSDWRFSLMQFQCQLIIQCELASVMPFLVHAYYCILDNALNQLIIHCELASMVPVVRLVQLAGEVGQMNSMIR